MKAIFILVALAIAAEAKPWSEFKLMDKLSQILHVRNNCPEHRGKSDNEISNNLNTAMQATGDNPHPDYTNGFTCQCALSPKEHKDLQTVIVPEGIKDRTGAEPVSRKRRATTTPSPASYDARTLGYVGPVLNQGSCGSCWTFSATGAMDGAIAKKTGKLPATSQQNLVDCVTASSGCNGGWMTDAYDYNTKNGGVDNSTVYPYLTKQQASCKYTKTGNVLPAMTSYNYTNQGDEIDLMNQLYTHGVISVAIQASDAALQSYKGGIYSCSNFQAVDHGVLLVGYGTNSTTGQDYWIVKNSWGTTWGESGYVRIIRNKGVNAACGLPLYGNYPII